METVTPKVAQHANQFGLVHATAVDKARDYHNILFSRPGILKEDRNKGNEHIAIPNSHSHDLVCRAAFARYISPAFRSTSRTVNS